MRKLIKYEFLNIFRNRWVFIYTALMVGLTFLLIRVAGDYKKVIVSLSSIAVVFVPLVASFFTTLYWYYSDRFTHLMLTQPICRKTLFLARFIALSVSLSACFDVGVFLGFLIYGEMSKALFVLILIATMLTFVFVALSLWISIAIADRMKGVGLVFSVWLYFVLMHDGGLLLLLIAFREYPMDFLGGMLAALSPIGLARVILMMYNESSLLLGHTGALVRNILTSWQGYAFAGLASFLWMIIPFFIAYRVFNKKDL